MFAQFHEDSHIRKQLSFVDVATRSISCPNRNNSGDIS